MTERIGQAQFWDGFKQDLLMAGFSPEYAQNETENYQAMINADVLNDGEVVLYGQLLEMLYNLAPKREA